MAQSGGKQHNVHALPEKTSQLTKQRHSVSYNGITTAPLTE